jgi:hypothetical protein
MRVRFLNGKRAVLSILSGLFPRGAGDRGPPVLDVESQESAVQFVQFDLTLPRAGGYPIR